MSLCHITTPPAALIRTVHTVFSILYQIMTSLCSSTPSECLLFVRFTRPPAPPTPNAGSVTSELVAGIPRLIRLMVPLNSRIITAPLYRLGLYSPPPPPGSLCRVSLCRIRLLIVWAAVQELSVPHTAPPAASCLLLFFLKPGFLCGACG